MLPQENKIEKVRQISERDESLVSALMYGSFALGQGDRFSDIEIYLFFEDGALESLGEEAWVGQIAPLEPLLRQRVRQRYGHLRGLGQRRVPLRAGLEHGPGRRVGERLVPFARDSCAGGQDQRTV